MKQQSSQCQREWVHLRIQQNRKKIFIKIKARVLLFIETLCEINFLCVGHKKSELCKRENICACIRPLFALVFKFKESSYSWTLFFCLCVCAAVFCLMFSVARRKSSCYDMWNIFRSIFFLVVKKIYKLKVTKTNHVKLKQRKKMALQGKSKKLCRKK